MKQIHTYACYISLLAATVCVSCQKTPGGAEATASGAPSVQQAETEIPSNTPLWVQFEKALDSSKLKAGDRFTGQIAEAVIFGGRPVIPKGSQVTGHVTNAQTAESQGSQGSLSMVLDSVSTRGGRYDIQTRPVTLKAPVLQQDLPKSDPSSKDVNSAFVPKNENVEFTLAEAIRVK